MKIRCLRCRKNYEVPEEETSEQILKNGSRMATTFCKVCGTKMARILSGAKKEWNSPRRQEE